MTTSILGDRLLALCARAERELVLCAPFMKAAVIARVLEQTPAGVKVESFTRWRADEVAAGVSDIAVLPLVEARGGAVYLCDRLHAKYARADDEVLLGSANLTAAALGWSVAPNLELLIDARADEPGVQALEEALRHESVPATQELAEQVKAAAELLPPPPVRPPDAEDELTEKSERPWHPQLREPFDLFTAYSEGFQALSRASARAARHDLAALGIPPGLEREPFEAVVASRLTQLPLIDRLGSFLRAPRRFGEVRSFLGGAVALDRDEAEHAWQTLMRWLLHFLPGQYVREVPSHTEVVVRRAPRGANR